MNLVFFEQAMQKRPAKGGFFGEVKIDVPEKAQVCLLLLSKEDKKKIISKQVCYNTITGWPRSG